MNRLLNNEGHESEIDHFRERVLVEVVRKE
jgi:hypothetical protein